MQRLRAQSARMARELTADTIATICEHMNDDHADALLHYARVFANRHDARAARLTGFDAAGLDLELELENADGTASARIAFDHTLRDADDARDTLIAMARA